MKNPWKIYKEGNDYFGIAEVNSKQYTFGIKVLNPNKTFKAYDSRIYTEKEFAIQSISNCLSVIKQYGLEALDKGGEIKSSFSFNILRGHKKFKHLNFPIVEL